MNASREILLRSEEALEREQENGHPHFDQAVRVELVPSYKQLLGLHVSDIGVSTARFRTADET